MGSRKESLKKSLGITEYPWSSDDDDEGIQTRMTSTPRTPPIESRPSVADMPGTSGVQPHSSSSSSARNRQANTDRDMFWSAVNINIRPASVPRSSGSRPRDGQRQSSRSSTPLAVLRRTERPVHSADVQRIVAFKKLTHSLNNMRQSRNNHNMFSTLRNSGSLRNTLFTPSSSGLSISRSNRSHSSRASQVHSPLPLSRSTGIAAMVRTPHIPSNSNRPRPDAEERVLYASTPPLPQPLVLDNAAHLEGMPPLPPREPIAQQVEVQEPVNNSTSSVSPEDDVLEVDISDAPDEDADAEADLEADLDAEAEAEPPVPMDEGEDSGTNESNGVVPCSNNASLQLNQDNQENQGVKRKRNVNEENGEPYSIKAFNQNLLRLLECPVCLEWMEPPIAQCRRGHLVCARCRVRLVFCPVCRTTFSSVRNRAMEGVAEMLRYPCRHSCGRDVRLRRRAAHEDSCPARRYHCPAPTCTAAHTMPRAQLVAHMQNKHLPLVKIGTMHKFPLRMGSEQQNIWIIMALDELFYLRVDVDLRSWGIIVYVAFLGPKCDAKNYMYEVSLEGQHSSRKIVYTRLVHSDTESPQMNVSRQDCFHLTLDQLLNFLRFQTRRCDEKYLDLKVQIVKKNNNNGETREESDS